MTFRLAIVGSMAAMLASPALATEFRAGTTVSIGADEVIDDDLFVCGNSVRVAGRVTGDVFAAGETVRVTGPVGGSVMAGGRSVHVSGDVDGSVRAGGGMVSLTGAVHRNAVAAAMNLVLAETSRVARDLHAAGRTIDLDGEVDRDATIFGGVTSVRGTVAERLRFEGDSLALSRSSRVGGNLIYRSPHDAEIAPGALIAGQVRKLAPHREPPPIPRRPISPATILFIIGFFSAVFFLTVLVSGWIGLAVAPRLFVPAADAMADRPWWNLLLGFLILVAAPSVAFAVCATVIGMPVGALALVAWGAALMFSYVPVAIFLGRWLVTRIFPRASSPYLGLLIGLIVLTLAGFIPFAGWPIRAVTVLFGLGVYARAVKGIVVEQRAAVA